MAELLPYFPNIDEKGRKKLLGILFTLGLGIISAKTVVSEEISTSIVSAAETDFVIDKIMHLDFKFL